MVTCWPMERMDDIEMMRGRMEVLCVQALMYWDMPVWLVHVYAIVWSSIIIFMMCQNFYNSKKNIVLITRQSEYFIICYLYKSLFHYYATGIRYLHWNICCIITTLCWWIILVMLSSLMRRWSWWHQNGGEEPALPISHTAQEWPLQTETDF